MRALVAILICAGCATAPTSKESAQVHSPEWRSLPTGEIQRVAFGSCSNQYLAQPIWEALVAAEPDLFLYQGDVIYGDAAPPGTRLLSPEIDQLAKMRMDYAFLGTHPGFAAVRENIPVMATWDDHDYGKNDGGAEFEHKQASRELFLDFFGEPQDSQRRRTPGIYTAEVFGPPGRRVQVIMLDTRFFRSEPVKSGLSKEQARERNLVGRYVPNEDPEATLLGDEQWAWLEEQLRVPAEVRLLNSSIQVVAGEKGAESWGNFPIERTKLYGMIEETNASGVVILSGDVHFAEISTTDEGPYRLTDFTSSPLAQYPTGSTGWEDCVNNHRSSATFAMDNFGLVEVDWEAQPSPSIRLAVVGDDGQVAFEHSLLLHDLSAR